MRISKWLVAAALAAVAVLAPGCRTAGSSDCDGAKSPRGDVLVRKTRPTMSPLPGVVEIYRGGAGVVGYVCLDASDTNFSWWLLNHDEQPPVMPRSELWEDVVEWSKVSSDPLTGVELCERYGPSLDMPNLWRVHRGTQEPCTVWVLH